ncbi:MAG: DUF1963 domain-containing protein, partial [Chloroflexota bacterium]
NGIRLNRKDEEQYERQLEEISEKAKDWQFLFQIDSDDRLNAMWGDAGILYILIPKTSLADLKFEDSWTIMQCT